MKTTGVVRRIDDLGRIVIPKEIRKTLRIKDGESVEIFLDTDNIILKKYYPLESVHDFYVDYADSMHSVIGGNVLIIDRDKIVAVSGDLKKSYLNKEISSSMDKIIQNRTILNSKDISDICLSGDLVEKFSYVIAPIIANGDAVGAVIILYDSAKVDDFIIKTCSIAAKFLGKYIE